ncbi:sulfurtransferase [Flexivirga caeni]|uniref:Sulfurtransferase n=1 Tax=Flexivirga caeni TaxID=2294115 RepID=A0A3M9M470_9MICO|nr:sulfurtransferase [Flexivirga caeni]
MDPFVTWRWCETHRASISIADARWYWDRPGADAYRAGHIPGAVFIDLDADLTGDVGEATGRQPFPEPEQFAAAMSDSGIDGTRPVVAYDDAGGVIAARLVWMLRLLDVPAAVLSGGIGQYPGALETRVIRPEPARFTPRPWPSGALWSTTDVATRTAGTLVDARPANRFRGDEPEVDSRLGKVPEADPRRGHIPEAVNVPCRDHLEKSGMIAPREHVRQTFAAAGIQDATNVISYCGAGVTACHNLLAMEYAGLGRGALYPGSWSAWSRTLHLPTELGPADRDDPADVN